MHKREMVEAMLGKIEQAIERILDNSRPIDSYHYYLVSPGGMERLESTCMLLMAIGEGLKGIDKLTEKLAKTTTDTELIGISIAATIGVSVP